MPVVFCGIVPHPPIMVPEVGGSEAGRVAGTRDAMMELGRRVLESGAQTLVMISPHGTVFRDAVAVNMSPSLKGGLRNFGAPGVKLEAPADTVMTDAVLRCAAETEINTVALDRETAGRYGADLSLDHGVTVPLYFLDKAGVRLPMTLVYMGFMPYRRLYQFGRAVQRAALEDGRKVAVVASGDLSHALLPGAPAGYDPMAGEFDRKMVDLVGRADTGGILGLDAGLVEKAGECGLRPIIMMLGTLDGHAVESEVLSYEGPFGVGYMVASLIPGAADDSRFFSGADSGKRKEGYLPGLARESLRYYMRKKKTMPPPGDIPGEYAGRAGVFVSLKRSGHLRGCIGTIQPQYGSIIEETINNAISAGHRDPRFYPVSEDELEDLDISVDVLGSPEPVKSMDELDPARYGVIVRSGRKQGLLLPNLEGVDSVEDQVGIARQKAGISPREPVDLERFEVIRHR